MKTPHVLPRPSRLLSAAAAALAVGVAAVAVPCGPFVDVTADGFCPFVLELFTLGITTGTTPTTYDPTSPVSRLQMAAFLSRTVDGVLKRGSDRAALNQFWTTKNEAALGLTTVGTNPTNVCSDGVDLWVANHGSNTVSRVRASDGRLLGTWIGATGASGIVAANGWIAIASGGTPGALYTIWAGDVPGAVETVATNLGGSPQALTFDGGSLWTANYAASVSIITPADPSPWTVTTVTTGFVHPMGAGFDGSNVWVTEMGGTLLRLDGNGAILQTVTVGSMPLALAFDGGNLWVTNYSSNSVTVVRASSGSVLQTLTGNGLNNPVTAAFDGQRVLVTNVNGPSVSLWKAADLTPIGSFSTGASTSPMGACSDGVNFWITLSNAARLARF